MKLPSIGFNFFFTKNKAFVTLLGQIKFSGTELNTHINIYEITLIQPFHDLVSDGAGVGRDKLTKVIYQAIIKRFTALPGQDSNSSSSIYFIFSNTCL